MDIHTGLYGPFAEAVFRFIINCCQNEMTRPNDRSGFSRYLLEYFSKMSVSPDGEVVFRDRGFLDIYAALDLKDMIFTRARMFCADSPKEVYSNGVLWKILKSDVCIALDSLMGYSTLMWGPFPEKAGEDAIDPVTKECVDALLAEMDNAEKVYLNNKSEFEEACYKEIGALTAEFKLKKADTEAKLDEKLKVLESEIKLKRAEFQTRISELTRKKSL